MNNSVTLETRAEASEHTQGAGLGLAVALPFDLLGQLAGAGSHDDVAGNGHQWLASLEYWSLRHGFTFRTEAASREYRQIGQDDVLPYRRQWLASYTYARPELGHLGLGYGKVETYDLGAIIDLQRQLLDPRRRAKLAHRERDARLWRRRERPLDRPQPADSARRPDHRLRGHHTPRRTDRGLRHCKQGAWPGSRVGLAGPRRPAAPARITARAASTIREARGWSPPTRAPPSRSRPCGWARRAAWSSPTGSSSPRARCRTASRWSKSRAIPTSAWGSRAAC